MRLASLFLALAFLSSGCNSVEDVPEFCEDMSTEVDIEDLVVGTSPAQANPNDVVRISFVGALEDGTVFDEATNVQFNIATSDVSGFREGMDGMRIGGVRRFVIPPNRGYGTQSQNRIEDGETIEVIPACSTLIFEVELIDILT